MEGLPPSVWLLLAPLHPPQPQQQYLGSFNWPFGSALSLLLIVMMTAGVIAYARVESGEEER